MAAAGPIVVIGSINMDLVCKTPRMPAPGETILGDDFVTIAGGKGANQAVAAARLGGDVHMVGRVGNDDFGQRLLTQLTYHGVKTKHVTVTEGVSSGVAMILVDKEGENSIVVAPGANHKLTRADVDRAEGLIKKASVVVLQLEIPLEVVRHAIAMCQRLKVMTVLDPAPVPEKGLPRALYGVDVFTPNQSEAERLLGLDRVSVKKTRPREPKLVGMDLLTRGPRAVVLKNGGKGSMVVTRDGEFHAVKPFKVKVVDTTAAGDAFTGALAVGRAEGMSLEEAARFGNAAGAICCESFGAQPSLPTRQQVERLMG